MPVYAFRCKKCGNKFEVSLSMKERDYAIIVCPECDSEDNDQLFDGVNVFTKSSIKSTRPMTRMPSCGPGCGGGCG